MCVRENELERVCVRELEREGRRETDCEQTETERDRKRQKEKAKMCG